MYKIQLWSLPTAVALAAGAFSAAVEAAPVPTERLIIPNASRPVGPGNLQVEVSTEDGSRYINAEFPVVHPHSVMVNRDRAQFYLRATLKGPGLNELHLKGAQVQIQAKSSDEVDVQCEPGEGAPEFSYGNMLALCSVKVRNPSYPYPDLKTMISKKLSQWVSVRISLKFDAYPVEVQPKKTAGVRVDLDRLSEALKSRMKELRFSSQKNGREVAPDHAVAAEVVNLIGLDPCGFYRSDLKGLQERGRGRNIVIFATESAQSSTCGKFSGSGSRALYRSFRSELYRGIFELLKLEEITGAKEIALPSRDQGVEALEIELRPAGSGVSDQARSVTYEHHEVQGEEIE